MSKINVREDKRESDTRKGFFIPNEYYQGNLNRAEKLEISGYDNAVANIEDFFLHLNTYKSELSAFFDTEKISEELSESSSEKISKQARMIKEIKECLLDWMELQRTDIIVGMLDDDLTSCI